MLKSGASLDELNENSLNENSLNEFSQEKEEESFVEIDQEIVKDVSLNENSLKNDSQINFCQICTEKFNGKLKKTVCPNTECAIVICRKCVQTWLLDPSRFNDAECMSCKIGLSRESLVEMCGKIWVNTVYARRREEILYDRIKSRLPEYQDHISSIKRIKKFESEVKQIFSYSTEIRKSYDLFEQSNYNLLYDLKRKYERYYNDINFRLTDKERDLPSTSEDSELILMSNEIRKEINDFMNRMMSYNERFDNLLKGLKKNKNTKLIENNELLEKEQEKEKKEKYLTRGPCPNQRCNGFIEDSWKCGICSTKICQSCMVIIDEKAKEKHICNETDIESVKLIRSSSKPCPNCRVRVTKSEGCTQMWCTNCNTAFDYNTLEIIVNKKIHNPHYFEFIKKNGLGNHGGYIGECGITAHTVNQKVNTLLTNQGIEINDKFQKIILRHLEDAIHIKANLQNFNNGLEKLYFDLGKSFLKNRIGLEYFRNKIQREEKAFSKINEVNAIRLTYADTVYDICNHLLLEDIKLNDEENLNYINKIIKMLTDNHEIATGALRKNAEIFNSSALNLRP